MIEPLEKLVDALTKLPTIGKKSGWRLALYLLEQGEEEVKHLARCLCEIKEKIVVCKKCFNYSETELCPICSSPSRNQDSLCIVEKFLDLFIIEQSGRYKGLYHVLGGVLSPINGITSDKLRIVELKARIKEEKPKEIIIGLSGSDDAETTSLYLTRLLSSYDIRITRFARGLPAGVELEYIDQITLNQALHERTNVSYHNFPKDSE